FFTSGPAVTVTRLPSGPLSVTSRVDLSIAVIVAVILSVCAATAAPGAVPTIAFPVCAPAAGASAMAAAMAMARGSCFSMGRLLGDEWETSAGNEWEINAENECGKLIPETNEGGEPSI